MLTSSDYCWKLSVQLSLPKCLYFLSVTCLLWYLWLVVYCCFIQTTVSRLGQTEKTKSVSFRMHLEHAVSCLVASAACRYLSQFFELLGD